MVKSNIAGNDFKKRKKALNSIYAFNYVSKMVEVLKRECEICATSQ